MKTITIFIIGVLALGLYSCDEVNIDNLGKADKSCTTNEGVATNEAIPSIMTPETLWKLGRVSEVQLSPDGKKILFGITRYNLSKNKGDKNLYVMNVDGSELTQLTKCKKGDYNGRWNADGSRIGFISLLNRTPQMWEMDVDGKNKVQITDIEGGISAFTYSNTSNKIAYSKSIKIDKTTLDLYPDLPLANAKIYDELMYRHWDHWADENYSHIFTADIIDGKITNSIDLMKGERYDASIDDVAILSKLVINIKIYFIGIMLVTNEV